MANYYKEETKNTLKIFKRIKRLDTLMLIEEEWIHCKLCKFENPLHSFKNTPELCPRCKGTRLYEVPGYWDKQKAKNKKEYLLGSIVK